MDEAGGEGCAAAAMPLPLPVPLPLPQPAAAAPLPSFFLPPSPPSRSLSSSSSCCVERGSAAGSDSDESDDERRAAQTGGDEAQFTQGPPLTPEQQAAAVDRLRQQARHILQHRGQPLPSKLERQLKVMVAQLDPTLLRVVHHFSIKDGSYTDTSTLASLLPSTHDGAPHRTLRPARPLSAEDRAELREEEAGHLWRAAAAKLKGDFDDIFEACSLLDAKEISAADRALSLVDGVSLVYGEAFFCSVAALLARHWRSLRRGEGTFVDLGSGSGRVVFGAMLLHEWKEIKGVEILRGLLASSKKVQQHYQQNVKEGLMRKDEERWALEQHISSDAACCDASSSAAVGAADSTVPPPSPSSFPPPSISLLHADFRALDWSDADVCFVNSTAFDEDLRADLALYARRLKRGSLIITFTHALRDSAHFRILSDDSYEQSWGWATAYAHRKISDPLWDRITPRVIDDMCELEKVMPDLPEEITSAFRAERELSKQPKSS